MYYPWWYIPVITSPMLIAFIAVVHILVSHYAVGGGILIAMENQFALKKGDKVYREYWKKHAKFFVLLTLVFGAITGVGIWWTIGLTSPLATEVLIRTFVFGWAIEWVFFLVEIVAAFILYYYWDRLPAKTSIRIGWIYAAAAWISLFLITGITGFMLNSAGLFGNWTETGSFWHAFFNVQLFPQTFVRTGGCLVLATLYVYIHASWTLRQPSDTELLTQVVQRMSFPLLFGMGTAAIGVGMWFANLPVASQMMLERAPVLNVFLGILAGLSALLFLMTLFGPVWNPRSVTLPFAVALFIFGTTAFAVAEFVREAVRKPYIVDQIVLGNQILVSDVPRCRENGFLNSGIWTQRERAKYPAVLETDEQRAAVGKTLFIYHCNDCHALDRGYAPAAPLLAGESRQRIADFIQRLNEPTYSMPPWCGTEEEAECLAVFLESVRPEHPRVQLLEKIHPPVKLEN